MTVTSKSHILGAGMALLMLPGLAIAAKADTTKHELVDPTVTVLNQKPQGQSVNISYAHVPKAGYLVIYGSDADGKPTGDPLGVTALKAGDHRDFKVELKAAPAANAKLWAALYEDKDGDAKLDKTKDMAFWPGNKLPWENKFQIQ